MKIILLLITFNLLIVNTSYCQDDIAADKQKKGIYSLVGKYAQARETKDSVLLKSILTFDIDQLVSSGEWRSGVEEAMGGMMKSSRSRPGSRVLKVEKIRFLNSKCAIADARYEIQNGDGTVRKMWSTFIVVYTESTWKITGIRNMLPAVNK